MIADLHAHYPMRALSEEVTPYDALKGGGRIRDVPGFGLKLQALILKVATVVGSNENWWSGYRITHEGLRYADVCLALSVHTRPQEEFKLRGWFRSPPQPGYFEKLMCDIGKVEAHVQELDLPSEIRIVHDRKELDDCLEDGATALVHAVEGGFSLGAKPEEITGNVATLASCGVGYVTLAHLFFRHVAKNTPAFPFMKDATYNRLFPQRKKWPALTPLGTAAIEAMVENRVMIDISHMRPDAITATFDLLDQEHVDPKKEFPVVATHAGYRFGNQEYMLDRDTLLKIKDRDGVVGLIMAQHQLNDGTPYEKKGKKGGTNSFDDSFDVVCQHIDKIAEITGGGKDDPNYRHIGLGTDFDGFIKPTLTKIEKVAHLKRLEQELERKYGKENAKLICSDNAVRVMRKLWPE